jgi:hypothetical protein
MIRDAFLETAHEARDLLASRAVGQAWPEPSTLREMSVGALAGHLARCAIGVEDYLDGDAPEPGAAPLTADQYYTRGVALTSDIHDALNAGVRERGEQMASDGQGALVERVDAALARLGPRLPSEPVDRLVKAFAGSVMTLDEYLVTRTLELAVHIDDLAVSVGQPTPELPPVTYMCALGCMLQMARARHGDLAVLRAMARRERDAIDALRVF